MNEPTSALLDPAAMAGMGIQQQPFDAPREDSLFIDESLELQVRMLRHNLQYSNMLQVLYGRPGAGKTTLTLHLIGMVNQELELFVVRGERGLTGSRIVADLLRAMERETTDDSATDLQAFTRELLTSNASGTPAALVVDDAHLLERRELEQLLTNTVEIDRGTPNGFRLLLVGEPSLRDKLDAIESPLLVPGRVYTSDIKPFSVEQTNAYLAHRLSGVGASWPFDHDEVASIAESADGLPGAIDRAAARALNHKHAVETVREPRRAAARTDPAGRPGMLRAAAAGLVVLIAVVWTLWPGDEPEPEVQTQPLALPNPPPLPANPVFKDEVPSPAQPEPGDTAPLDAPAPGADGAAPGPAVDPVAEAPVVTQTASVAPQAPAIALQPEPEPEPEPEPDTQPTVPEPRATPEPVTQPPPKREPGPAQKSDSQPQAAAAGGGPAPASVELPHDAAWLKAQRKEHYVVQLMAAHDLQVVRAFIREHGLGSKAAVFSTRRAGRPWHVLLYGLYANAEVARATIPQLPAALRRQSPWIRSLASVHEAIRERKP